MLQRLETLRTKWLQIAVIILIMTTVLLPKLPLSDVPNTYIKFRWDDVVGLGTFLIWAAGLWWLKKDFYKSRINQAIFLYWFVGFVSLVASILLLHIAPTNVAILNWLRRIQYMVFFFIGVSATPSVSAAIKYLYALFISTVLAVIYGLGQVKLGWCSFSTSNREFSKGECLILTKDTRVNSTFAAHYDLAIYLGFVLPIILAMFFAFKRFWQKIFLVGVFFSSLWLLTLTQARTGFVAALLTIAALLWFYGKRLWLIGLGALAGIFILTVGHNLLERYTATFTGLHTKAPQAQTQQIPIDQLIAQTTTAGAGKVSSSSAIPGQDDRPTEAAYRKATVPKYTGADPSLEATISGNIRFNEEWPRALRSFYRNPLLGSGYASMGTLFADQYGFATDNDYLRSLGEVGLLGTITMALIFVIFFRDAHQYLLRNRSLNVKYALVISIAAALVGFFANAVFIDAFESSKLAIILWLFMGITVGVMKEQKT